MMMFHSCNTRWRNDFSYLFSLCIIGSFIQYLLTSQGICENHPSKLGPLKRFTADIA